MAAPTADGRSDTSPRELHGNPMPEPAPGQSAGPIKPGRGSALEGKLAVVTGAARGIGRAIAVEFAANGADVVCIDICGPVSSASNAVPATPVDLNETVRQIKAYGRLGEGIQADIRDIGSLRHIADDLSQRHQRMDIVVAKCRHPAMDALVGNGRRRLAGRDRQQPERHRQHDQSLRPQDARRGEGTDHRPFFNAGQTWHERCRELLGVQVGHSRLDEIGGARTWSVRHYRQCGHSWSGGYSPHSIRQAPEREHRGGNGTCSLYAADAEGSLGRPRVDRRVEGGLASTR
ncbi:MAG: SDR family NAD(P)-dependent oxidoreductase [Alphaproteobacteria bacterium]|nr:SDR family NAD(P)-dependent oxidoreductase [Alphaproteobacteria bacterium]MBV8411350.1 SDR family NAD(P)-dependent oxidoreductase [Alphaproteobacteria bacterium]